MTEGWFAIAIGGAGGALLRGALVWLLAWLSVRTEKRRFVLDPAVGVLVANGLGCALLGTWMGPSETRPLDLPLWADAFVVTGLCGGLTTFSTLCADAVRLHRERAPWNALAYLLATALTGFAAYFLGSAISS